MTTVLESEPLPSNPPSTDKLAGRVAFVTGGTRGIGAAIAHSLANQGATVAVGYHRDRDSADQFVADLLKKTRPYGASASAHRGNVAASKSGLFGLTTTLAKEAAYQLAKSGKNTDDGIGITVNTVTPGLITTEMTADIPEKVMAKLTSQIPVGRAGRPEEVARVVHFLAADASPYITGQVWSVNGGMDM